MKTTVTLGNKDVREIIAKFLGVKLEDVIPNRYSFCVANISAEEIERRIKNDAEITKIIERKIIK